MGAWEAQDPIPTPDYYGTDLEFNSGKTGG